MARKEEFVDDGRTIADMSDLERGSLVLPRRKEKRSSSYLDAPLSRDERRMYTFAALKAALLIAAVFIVAFGLVILAMCLFW